MEGEAALPATLLGGGDGEGGHPCRQPAQRRLGQGLLGLARTGRGRRWPAGAAGRGHRPKAHPSSTWRSCRCLTDRLGGEAVERPQLITWRRGLLELVRQRLEGGESVHELVALGPVHALSGNREHLVDDVPDVEQLDRRHRHADHLLGHEVPVALELERDVAEGLDRLANLQQEQQGLLVVGRGGQCLVVEEPVDEGGPPVVEGQLRGDLVGDLHPRRQPGLQRLLGEEPLGEGVQGAHGGAVEIVERLAGTVRRRPRRRGVRRPRAPGGPCRAARRRPCR